MVLEYPPGADPRTARDSLESNPITHEEPAPFIHLYKTGFDGQALINAIESDNVDWHWSATGGTTNNPKFSLTRDSRSMSLDGYIHDNRGFPFTAGQVAGFGMLLQIERAVWDYRLTYNLDLKDHQGWSILKYGYGGQYLMHTDHGRNDPRRISVVAYLNTVKNSGATIFPYVDVAIQPVEGNIAVFPSGNAYSHLAEPAQETKYAAVSWFI